MFYCLLIGFFCLLPLTEQGHVDHILVREGDGGPLQNQTGWATHCFPHFKEKLVHGRGGD